MRQSTHLELFTAVFLIAIATTIALAAKAITSETQARVLCATNLRVIGQAMLLYSNDNKGAYPRTLWDSDHPTPTWGTPYEADGKPGAQDPADADPFDAKKSKVLPKPNDVTAVMFLLLRTQDIAPSVFVCPTTGSQPLNIPFGKINGALRYSNFPGAKALADHLSYSMANPYVSRELAKDFKWTNMTDAELVVAGDMNGGVAALAKLTRNSRPAQMKAGNSPNHNFAGQNLLYGDGHIEWAESPFVGAKRDNVYTFGHTGDNDPDKPSDGIVGTPVSDRDSALLPTAKDLGVIDDQGKFSAEANERRMKVAAQFEIEQIGGPATTTAP